MKQHFPLIVVSAFIAFIVVSLASQFIDLPSLRTLVETMSADPNQSKESISVQIALF